MFIAKQPVFDRKEKVFGYELLYRGVGEETYTCEDGSLATSQVITGSFLSANYSDFVGDKKVFIHFTEVLVKNDVATLFPPDRLVIEVENLSSVSSTDLLEACRKMYQKGYVLSFDQSVLLAENEAFLAIAGFIKVDILNSSRTEVAEILKKYRSKVEFLAMKLETAEAYTWAFETGFSYFQGYYFAKPQIIEGDSLSPVQLSVIRMIQELQSEEIDLDRVTSIIEHDVSFSYEILKLINSAYFYRGYRIDSVRDAVIRLGAREIRKWGMITALRKNARNENMEVLNYSLVRARFMEQIAEQTGNINAASRYLTVGILSMIDVLLNLSMAKILEDLQMPQQVEEVLLRRNTESELYKVLQMIISCEQGAWDNVNLYAQELQIPLMKVANIHNEAIKWTLEFQKSVS